MQRQSGSTLEHAGLTNRKEAWPKCILYGQLCSLEQHRQTCVLIDDDCPQPVHVKTDVQMSVKDERDGQKKIRWMKYIKISVKQNEVKYQCTLCDKALSSRGSIRNHVQTHLGDASFECGECGKMFGRIDHLRRHAKSHAKVKSFNCSQCDQSFTRSDRLKLHIRRCHDLNNVLYRCTYPNCNKAFSRSDVIRIHMRVHTGEKPYQCFRCGSSWAMQSNMTAHMRICGKQENPFKCRHCGAKFRSRRQVNKHQSVHYSEQPLTCNVCGRTFMTSHGLTSHAVTHVNSKQIICADCNKTFPSVQSLKDHISRHHLDRCDSKPVESVDCRRSNDLKRPRSKSRRPSCGDCCRCGQRIEDREKHACVDAEKKRFKCEYCTMRFAWPRSLRTHVERSHGESRIRRQDACKKKPEDGKDVATGRSVPDDDVGGLQITDGAETFSERNDGSINGAEDDVKPEIEVERSRCGENVADAKLSAAVSLVQSNCEGAKREFIIKREPSASPSAVTMDPAEKHEDLTSQNDAVTSLRCGLCHKIFSTRSILKRHMGVHSESRPFVCTSCGRCFRRSDTLSAHVTTHSRQ